MPPALEWTRAMEQVRETFNPWTVVNVVFHHLAAQGLHPVLGGPDPGAPAAELLRALGIEPAAEGDRQVSENVRRHLAELRGAVFGDPPDPPDVAHP
jgi:hypothetical protein